MNLKTKLSIILQGLLIYRKFRSFMLIVWVLTINNLIVEGNEFKEYDESDAVRICNKYVLNQRIYLNKGSKEIVNQWSSRYFKPLNEYIRGIINPSIDKIREFEKFRENLSDLIESTNGLEVDTILFRGEKDVDVESRFRVGEENTFSGFVSTSFSIKTAKRFSKSLNNNGYIIKIRAKKNTKGIAINGEEIGSFKNQKEWLLNEDQKYITIDVDEKNRIIEIELL